MLADTVREKGQPMDIHELQMLTTYTFKSYSIKTTAPSSLKIVNYKTPYAEEIGLKKKRNRKFRKH